MKMLLKLLNFSIAKEKPCTVINFFKIKNTKSLITVLHCEIKNRNMKYDIFEINKGSRKHTSVSILSGLANSQDRFPNYTGALSPGPLCRMQFSTEHSLRQLYSVETNILL